MKEEKDRKRQSLENGHNILNIFGKVIGIGLWASLIIVCIVNREKISVDGIVGLVPKDSVLSVIVMLLLFAIKGVAVFILAVFYMRQAEYCFRFPWQLS